MRLAASLEQNKTLKLANKTENIHFGRFNTNSFKGKYKTSSKSWFSIICVDARIFSDPTVSTVSIVHQIEINWIVLLKRIEKYGGSENIYREDVWFVRGIK